MKNSFTHWFGSRDFPVAVVLSVFAHLLVMGGIAFFPDIRPARPSVPVVQVTLRPVEAERVASPPAPVRLPVKSRKPMSSKRVPEQEISRRELRLPLPEPEQRPPPAEPVATQKPLPEPSRPPSPSREEEEGVRKKEPPVTTIAVAPPSETAPPPKPEEATPSPKASPLREAPPMVASLSPFPPGLLNRSPSGDGPGTGGGGGNTGGLTSGSGPGGGGSAGGFESGSGPGGGSGGPVWKGGGGGSDAGSGGGNGGGNGPGTGSGPARGGGSRSGSGFWSKLFRSTGTTGGAGGGSAGGSGGRGGGPSPRYGETPKPNYPPEAKKKGFQGEVLVRARVLASGRVSEAEVKHSSGYEILDHAALAAVKQWKFVPAREDGEDVPAWVNIPIRFQLQ